MVINCVDNVGVNVVVGRLVLNAFVPVHILFVDKLTTPEICVCKVAILLLIVVILLFVVVKSAVFSLVFL